MTANVDNIPISNGITLPLYTLFQNDRNVSILLFTWKLALVVSFKGKYSFEF